MQASGLHTAPAPCHRLVTLVLAALLGWALLAAITLPAGAAPAPVAGQLELSQASSPYGDWLADELRNRSGLRTKPSTAAGSDDTGEDGADGLGFLRLYRLGPCSSGISGHQTPATPARLANPRTSPRSPRAPPAPA